MNTLPDNIEVRHDMRPGDIGYLTYLHGILYAQEFGWDATFEAEAALVLSDFAKSKSPRQRIWLVEKNQTLAGSIAISESSAEQARLRVLLLHPDLRGLKLGKWLVEQAVRFSRDSGYASIFLTTTRDLVAAAHLYRSAGFELRREEKKQVWGVHLVEQRYEMKLDD